MAHNSAYYPQQQQPQRQYTQPTQVYPQSQPQNIYQQLGKPQPQPHLQGHPTYQQSSALVIQPQGGHPFSQQLPAQVQSSSPLGEAPHAPPQTPYQLSQAPHVSPQTPYPQSQTPYLPSQPPYTQSQAVSQTPYTSSQTPYQQTQYQGQQLSQQAYSSRSQSHVSYVPQTSFISQTPGAVPTSSSGSSWRVPASWPPPVAHSATLAQQAQSQVHAQVEPQVTSQTLAQTPAQRPLPLPSTGANATILPFSSQSADNPPPGSNRPFPTLALQATMAPSSNPPSPRRGRPLPTPTGTIDKRATVDLGRLPHGFLSSFANSAISTQPSILSQPQPITTKRSLSPSKRPLPAPSSHGPVKKSESVVLSRTSSFAIQNSTSSASSTAATPRRISPPRFQFQPPSESSSPTKENATTSSSTSSTSATTSNSTSDTSVPSPKKFTPIWKHTIRDYPAPAWGYAVGMASKPHPKPNAQVPTQPAPAGAPPANDVKGKLKKKNETVALPPPPVLVVSSTKGTTQHQQYPPSQYRQLGQPGSTSFIQPGVQQRHSYQQQQQQQAYYGHARTPATYRETQAEGEEDEEEDSEEETDSDEEDEGEDDDEDEDEEQPDPRYNPQIKRQKYKRPMASIASGAQSLSRGYDQNFKEVMICTPKRKLKLKPKIKKMDPYTAYIDVNTNGHKSRIVPRRGGQQTHGRQARPASGLICGGCNGSIIGRIVSAMESRWHPACFRCTVCNELLEHVSSYEHEGRPYCHLDYHENFAPRCYSCKTAIIEEQFISLDDPALGKRTYHTQHFFCAECGDPFLAPSVSFPDSTGEVALSGDGEFEGFTVYKGYPYCEACHVRLRLPKCKRCKRSIRDHDEAVEALGGKWCWGCFVCATCNEPFENPSFFQRDDKPFCERCFSIMLRNEV